MATCSAYLINTFQSKCWLRDKGGAEKSSGAAAAPRLAHYALPLLFESKAKGASTLPVRAAATPAAFIFCAPNICVCAPRSEEAGGSGGGMARWFPPRRRCHGGSRKELGLVPQLSAVFWNIL